MINSYKLIFWDWLGTLYSDDVLYKSRLQSLIERGDIDSELNFEHLSFNEALQVKSKLKKIKGGIIPFTWFLVHEFTKIGAFQVVISNGAESFILEELNLFNPFDLVLTAENFQPKPSLEMPIYAMEKLGVLDKKDILLIGDSLIDKKVADELGVHFFKIDDYYESPYEISKELGFI